MSKKFLKVFLIVVGAIILLIAIGSIGAAIKVSNSDAYEFAKKEILKSKKVEERIGKIKDFSLMPQGVLKKKEAQIEIDVYGENGKANIILKLEKNSKDEWEVLNFYFKELK
ncbi:cytochrome c oxidase assembly factor Coa1 family protein [Kordia algicida OT-1]|uniref:Uncharacterized protein n=1 Tax=Kordia algicida OT-1 TaxID=391587 RepID=A9EC63_9FLAO|nr:cytochrome c oxidase assembly factor Coa1 family protein [Kordia algicida]EDP94444.1 hypothetical protein KAOT1_04715 [Kordia algicida OT-1]